jgi:hypothetical protein
MLHIQSAKDARPGWHNYRLWQFRKPKKCEEGEAAFVEAVFFGEEFKEIHAAIDPAEMAASKQEISASPPTFKPTVDTKQVELIAGDAAKTTSIGTNLSPK